VSAAVWPVCPWQASLFYKDGAAECRAHKADWYDRIIPELDPDIVFLASHPYDDPVSPAGLVASGGRLAFGTPEASAVIRDATAATIEQLRADGRDVVIVAPVEAIYGEFAQDDDIYTLNLDNVVCPYFPICDPVVDGLIVKRDVGHLTGAFSESLTDDLQAFLRYTGLLEAS
jgi:hypothetical protein